MARNILRSLGQGKSRALVTFCIVGAFGAVLDYGSMQFLEAVGLDALLSRGMSYVLGSLFAYYANSFFTFSGNRSRTEKVKAFSVYTVCLIVVTVVNKMARLALSDAVNYIFIAWLISQAVATALNFLLQSRWVFVTKK